MVIGHCNSCVYFEDHKMMGVCKRFPQYANRHATEWCGEHKGQPLSKKEAVEVLDAVNLVFEKELENSIKTDIPTKKRGRPAKVQHD